MKTLYVTDLDGTLLNSRKCISEYSIKIINELVKKGMNFTYATARSLSSASIVAKGLNLQMPIVAYNGAHIFDPNTGEVVASEGFTREETDEIATVLKKCGVHPLVYSFVQKKESVSWEVGRETEGVQKYIDSRAGDKRLRPLDTSEHLCDGDVFYFTCIGDKTKLQPVYDILSQDERFTCTLQEEIYRQEEYWCEIMPKRATKANAILRLKELWNCDRVVSFGDAINDIPMFRISDECYAVENAVDELKRLATGIIGGNDADGVAIWLKEKAVLE